MTEKNDAPAAETPDATRVRTLRYGIVVLLALCAVIFASITMYAIQDSDGTIEDVSGAFMGQMSAQIRLNFDSELRLYRSEMESVALSALSYELRPGEIALDAFKAQAEGRGFTFRYFETGAEAADYLTEQLAGKTVGIGGSKTVEAIGLYEKLQGKAADVAWHWKTEPNEARARAAKAQIYVSSANGIAETGEIINIDGAGNRVASNLYGHEKVYIVAGVNKVCPDVEKAFWRARNVAAPLNARRFGKDTPCVKGELKCYDCRSADRICRGVSMLMEPMIGMPIEVVIINEELGY